MMYNTGVIILAAGSSSRLGQPKQLLDFNGKNFIQNTIQEAIAFAGKATVVVTGANSDAVDKFLFTAEVMVCHNPHWELGMGVSIKTGLKHLLDTYPEMERCVFTVCDQPYVTAEIFRSLDNQQISTGKGIVASAYSGIYGVPVMFTKPYFEKLLLLKGQEGARKLLSKFIDDVASVPFDKGAIDIDTLEDYDKLIK